MVLSRSCILQRGNLVGADGKSYRCSRSACVVLAMLKESVSKAGGAPQNYHQHAAAHTRPYICALIMHRLCFANSGHNKSDNGLSSAARTNSSVLPHTLPSLFTCPDERALFQGGFNTETRGRFVSREKENILLFSDVERRAF